MALTEITKTYRVHDFAVTGPPFNVAPWTDKRGPGGSPRAFITKKRGEKQARPTKVACPATWVNVGRVEQVVVFTILF